MRMMWCQCLAVRLWDPVRTLPSAADPKPIIHGICMGRMQEVEDGMILGRLQMLCRRGAWPPVALPHALRFLELWHDASCQCRLRRPAHS